MERRDVSGRARREPRQPDPGAGGGGGGAGDAHERAGAHVGAGLAEGADG